MYFLLDLETFQARPTAFHGGQFTCSGMETTLSGIAIYSSLGCFVSNSVTWLAGLAGWARRVFPLSSEYGSLTRSLTQTRMRARLPARRPEQPRETEASARKPPAHLREHRLCPGPS